MDISERNKRLNLQQSLLLAASDMEQAAAAAAALQVESNVMLARALETGMTVCYMRPFTKAELALPSGYEPVEDDDGRIHADMKVLRDKYYAHSDRRSGRGVRGFKMELGETTNVTWEESRKTYPHGNLPHVIDLCGRLAESWKTEAARIQLELDA